MAVRPSGADSASTSTSSEDQRVDRGLPITLTEEQGSNPLYCIRPIDIPSFSGSLADYPVYRMRVRALWKSVQKGHRATLIEKLIDQLPGGSREAFGHRGRQEFGGADGLQLFWTAFTSRYTWPRETVLRQAVTGYFNAEWQNGETLQAFLRRFKDQEYAFVESVQDCLKYEAKVVFHRAMAHYVEERRRWTQWHAAAAIYQEVEGIDKDDLPVLRELAAEPVMPIMPAAPDSVLFWWPDILSGCVLMAHLGLTAESQAQLVQAAGGTFQYGPLVRALLEGSIHVEPAGPEPEVSSDITPKKEPQEALAPVAQDQLVQTQTPGGCLVTLDSTASSLLEVALTSLQEEDAVALVQYICNARNAHGALPGTASSAQRPSKRTRQR